jgi:hypothetical protein
MDCLEGLKQLEDDSVDAVVTDPPYGMSFMGKNWDKALPDPRVFRECLRVLKPGGFALVMSAPRSDLQSRMSIMLEDAGFRIDFTPIYWTYATGFPKAQDISKQIDKRNGRNQPTEEFKQYLKDALKRSGLKVKDIHIALNGTDRIFQWQQYTGTSQQTQYPTVEKYQILKEILNLDNTFDELIGREEAQREVISKRRVQRNSDSWECNSGMLANGEQNFDITVPALDESKRFEGAKSGFQPKPAVEVIIVAMKPLSEKTYVDQA